jgi:hypothetical protein
VCPVCQTEAGQGHAGETQTELLQRRAPRGGSGQTLGEFIELVVHTFFPFFLFFNRLVLVCSLVHWSYGIPHDAAN